MDESIKQSIEARYSSFVNSYEIKDDDLKKEINCLFDKIKELGQSCTDVREFEAKFAKSPLSGEYSRLFRKLASICDEVSMDKLFKNYALSDSKDDNFYQTEPKEEDIAPVKKKLIIEEKIEEKEENKLKEEPKKTSFWKKLFKK